MCVCSGALCQSPDPLPESENVQLSLLDVKGEAAAFRQPGTMSLVARGTVRASVSAWARVALDPARGALLSPPLPLPCSLASPSSPGSLPAAGEPSRVARPR